MIADLKQQHSAVSNGKWPPPLATYQSTRGRREGTQLHWEKSVVRHSSEEALLVSFSEYFLAFQYCIVIFVHSAMTIKLIITTYYCLDGNVVNASTT